MHVHKPMLPRRAVLRGIPMAKAKRGQAALQAGAAEPAGGSSADEDALGTLRHRRRRRRG